MMFLQASQVGYLLVVELAHWLMLAFAEEMPAALSFQQLLH